MFFILRTTIIVGPYDSSYYRRISVVVPNIGWWISVGYNTAISNVLVDNGTWVVGPSLPTEEEFGYSSRPRKFCGCQLNATHTMVTGGQVGLSGSSLSDVWLYDWSSGQWKVGRNMTNPRRNHHCTSISGGRVVVAGGTGLYGQDLSDIEVFDPAADGGLGGWYSMGDLPDSSDYPGAELLYNGNNFIYLHRRKIWLYDESEASWTEFGKDLTSTYYSGNPVAMIPEDFLLKKVEL